MNLFVKRLLVFFVVFISFLSVGLPVFAQRTQKNVVLSQNSVINHDYFRTGNTVIISGTVNGDAYVAGGNVIVDGRINGDLLAAGGDVTVHGTVAKDVRVIGGNITISGNIGGNVTAVGGNITITNSASIAGSFVTASGGVDVLGKVGKNITAATGQMTVANTVNGSITGPIGQLMFTPKAKVGGNVTYYSNQRAEIAQGASIAGTVSQKIQPMTTPQRSSALFFRTLFLVITVTDIISSFIIGALLLKLFPFFTQRITDGITKGLWGNMLIGVIAVIVAPVLGMILLITIVGIPIGFILFMLYVIYLYVAKIYVANAIGRKITKGTTATNYLFMFFIGLIIYEVISIIPIIGGLFVFLAVITSIGSMLRTSYDFYYLLVSKKLA